MGKKAEARAARTAEKDPLRKVKPPAFDQLPSEDKEPASAMDPEPKGVPAIEVDPKYIRKQRPQWLLDKICCCFPSPWSEIEWTKATWDTDVAPKLKSFGSMT